jgi:hypothetical protein
LKKVDDAAEAASGDDVVRRQLVAKQRVVERGQPQQEAGRGDPADEQKN